MKDYHKLDKWIEVKLNNENELEHIKTLLEKKRILNKKHYLFLDIDGVLNTGQYSKYLTEHNLTDFDENGTILDPNAVEKLRYIIESTHADIIISSTWRYDGFNKMQKLWDDRNLPGKLVGITPHIVTTYFEEIDSNEKWQKRPIGSKGMEIDEWLRLNTNEMLEPYTYAILDDEDDFLLHQAKHVVLTDSYYGITENIANKVIKILNND